jgi:hypothetical protein
MNKKLKRRLREGSSVRQVTASAAVVLCNSSAKKIITTALIWMCVPVRLESLTENIPEADGSGKSADAGPAEYKLTAHTAVQRNAGYHHAVHRDFFLFFKRLNSQSPIKRILLDKRHASSILNPSSLLK